jgi:hypothetical protein
MTIKLIFGAALIVTVASTTAVLATHQNGDLDSSLDLPTVATAELPVNLVYARAFELGVPAQHMWSAEQAIYSEGVLVVLEANPTWLAPRQSAEPVIYVGDQVLERINTGYPSGQLVGIVPGMSLEELANAPIFFGQPALPESIGAEHISAELGAAVTSGLTGPGAALVGAASDAVGGTLTASDLRDLYESASYVIERYSPEETSLIEGLRVTRVEFK